MVHITEFDKRPNLQSWELPQNKANESDTVLEHISNLRIDSPTPHVRLTSISCAIGVSSRSIEMLEQMIEAGMNIARLTFNTGTHDFHLMTIENIREAASNVSKKLGYQVSVAIGLDSKGAEIRTGLIKNSYTKEVNLVTGNMIKITTNTDYRENGDENIVWIDYLNIISIIKRDDIILIDNGYIVLRAKEIVGDTILCLIQTGGKLHSRKNVNLPGISVDLPSMSEKDKHDFAFAVQNNLDIIFASFVRSAAALHEIRDELGVKGQKIKIISKIENQQALENIDEIIAASDGIMIGRGDMGNEFSFEKVFLAQKYVAARCNKLGVPVVCSYQLMASMVKKPQPTRAEVCDVANAVLDGVDCISFSAETSKGYYPLEVVKTTAQICKEAEGSLWYKHLFKDLMIANNPIKSGTDIIGFSVVDSSMKLNASAIIVVAGNGDAAYSICKYRPRCPIIAVTRNAQVARQANLYRGIIGVICNEAIQIDPIKDAELNIFVGVEFAKQREIIKVGETIVLVTGTQRGTENSKSMRIVTVE